MKAAVILQKCAQTRKTFGIRIEELEDGEWYRTWAFPIDERRASQEGYDRNPISSRLPKLESYPGCPYCGAESFFYDCNCGKICCYRGESSITCPWCGVTYNEIGAIKDKLQFQGGDL